MIDEQGINHEYDDKQGEINWEDHIGLCVLAADMMVRRDPRLKYYHLEIIQDLKYRLWYCSQDGKYDERKGRFSTYAMRSMIRSYTDIVHLYFGERPRRKFEPDYILSLDCQLADDLTFGDFALVQDAPDIDWKMDLEDAVESTLAMFDDDTAKFYRAYMETGQTMVGAMKAAGVPVGGRGKYIWRKTKAITYAREHMPARIKRIEKIMEESL